MKNSARSLLMILGMQLLVGSAYATDTSAGSTPVPAPADPQWVCDGILASTSFSKTVSLAGTQHPVQLAQDGKKTLSIGGSNHEVVLTLDNDTLIAVEGVGFYFSDSYSGLLVKCSKVQ